MLHKPASTSVDIHPLLRDRWSPRAFDSRPLSQEQIISLFEAARWAPSGGNGQPWSFIAVQRSEEGFADAVSALNEGNLVWAQQAPLLFVAVAQLNRDNGAPNRTALYDLGQAVAHLTFQAASLGLMVHQMGGFSAERAREVFDIPAGYEPITCVVVGYQADGSALPESLHDRERAPRSRKPLDQLLFSGRWGVPIEGQAEQV
jgi:nitroreductase